jgi:hypothetical protein
VKIEFVARNIIEIRDSEVAQTYLTTDRNEILRIDREAFLADPLLFLDGGTFEVKVIDQ